MKITKIKVAKCGTPKKKYIFGKINLHNIIPPPPVIVLGAELEIDHDDADLRAGDDQDDEDEKEESEEIVELVLVDGREDEEQLDEASPEWQDAGHQRAQGRMHVPDLFWNLPRNLEIIKKQINY